MRIGELATRAGASPRQVRFYEAQGLIRSDRLANNYRDYDDTALARVLQIRELLQSGLSIALVRAILPCLESPLDPVVFDGVTDETVAVLEQQLRALSARLEVLARNRDAVATYLAELRARRATVAGAAAVRPGR